MWEKTKSWLPLPFLLAVLIGGVWLLVEYGPWSTPTEVTTPPVSVDDCALFLEGVVLQQALEAGTATYQGAMAEGIDEQLAIAAADEEFKAVFYGGRKMIMDGVLTCEAVVDFARQHGITDLLVDDTPLRGGGEAPTQR